MKVPVNFTFSCFTVGYCRPSNHNLNHFGQDSVHLNYIRTQQLQCLSVQMHICHTVAYVTLGNMQSYGTPPYKQLTCFFEKLLS